MSNKDPISGYTRCVICGSTDGAYDGICNFHFMVYQNDPETLDKLEKEGKRLTAEGERQ